MTQEQLKQKEALQNLLHAMAYFKKTVGDHSNEFNEHENYFINIKLQQVDAVVAQDYLAEQEKLRKEKNLQDSSQVIEDFYKLNFMELNNMPMIGDFSRTLNIEESDINQLQFPMDLEEPVQKLKPRK